MNAKVTDRRVIELRKCLLELLQEPRRSPVLISKKSSDLTIMNATFTKGQVLRALRLCNDE